MTTVAIVFAVLICAGVLYGVWSMKRDVDVETLLKAAPAIGKVSEIELLLESTKPFYEHQHLTNVTPERLTAILKSSRWWLRTAHALLREPSDEDAEGELILAQKLIAFEYRMIVKLYWRARLELLVSRIVPVQYVYFTGILQHFLELNSMVHYVCSVVRSDLQDRLEAIT